VFDYELEIDIDLNDVENFFNTIEDVVENFAEGFLEGLNDN